MKVLRIQKDWRQLVHVCLWDLGICRLSQGKWKEAEECYTILYEESNWSKVVYRYLQAMCVYAQVGQEGANKVKVMIADMPKHVKKIAGKSLPMEVSGERMREGLIKVIIPQLHFKKFLCRKARKFVQQGDRLFLPQFEVLYFLYSMDKNSFERYSVMIREIDQGIRELERDEKSSASAVTNANGSKVPYATYFDDLCLARYLKAICEREKGFPGHLGLIPSKPQTMQAIIFRKAMQLPNGNGLYYDDKPLPVSLSKEEVPMKEPTPTQLQSLRVAILNFQAVKQQSVEIELDHWMLAFTCYEMGVLYMRIGEWELARREFEMSLGGAASDNGEQQVVHQHTGGKVSSKCWGAGGGGGGVFFNHFKNSGGIVAFACSQCYHQAGSFRSH